YTSSLDVIVHIHKDFIPEMKVTQNATCDGGVWEANAPTKNIHLNMPNSVNDVSVQFRDYDKNISECFVTQVVHDNTPPTVSVSGIMTPVTVNVATAVSIQISDSGSGLKSATCTINNVSTSCSTTSLANSVIGTQTLQVIAIDRTGNQTTTSTSWTVQEKQPDLVRHNIATRIQSNTKSDILFVIDNSGSMQYEQQSMANRMSHFIHAISGLDWRIGITTTDPDHPVWGDGRLVKMKNINDQYVLTNNGPEDRLQEILGNTIQRKEVGSGSEQGIKAVYRAIQRSFEIPKGGVRNPNRELFRDDANLSVVIISDENESAHRTMNDPAQLARFMKGQWPQKKINVHSIITRPNDVKCLRSYGASYGVAYWELSHMFNFGEAGGSTVGDVCATDYTSQLVGIGHAVSDLQKVIKLDCEPKGDTSQNIMILHNAQNFTEPFTIDGKSLVFQDPLPLGIYELQYYCSQ
ncbi:MAG TPA: hypothetical protein PLU50_04505, partial [Pseudobdellovibrionaceae bacterium]|nr:hypothetical protein [Pseudobdellovibrionaceae bacterium]